MVKTLRSPQHKALIAELRRVRQHVGLTQVELAERLGVAQSFVAKVEAAERRLEVVEFVRWLEAADALGEAASVLDRVRSAQGNS